jgi:aminopeptidase N
MPGDGVRVVVVRRPRTSGYARKGYIVFTENSRGNEAGVAKFAAHEFAHLWFSNANSQTSDRWLDESTAEYVSLRYVQDAMGAEALERLIAPKREVARTAKPVVGDTRTDAELYDKGPLLLFELEQAIGREKMDRLLAIVAARKIGVTADFLTALSELTDPATAAEFERKLKS